MNPNFDPTLRRSRTRLPLAGILLASCLFAAQRGAPTAATDETSDELEAGGGGTATGTGVTSQSEAKTETKGAVKTKTVEEAVADNGLLELVKAYDDVKEKANSYMCDMAEYIGKENLGRPVVIKTLMDARGVTLETAASSASRLMKLAKDPDSIKGLRDGTLTVRETLYGRPKPGTTTDAGGGEGGTGGTAGAGAGEGTGKGKSDSEKKEDRYNRELGAFVKTAKECGYSLDEIITGVRASLKDAGVK